MFTNYLKIALRNIKKFKGYSFINIIGLAMGMALVILIVLYVRFELSYDRYHEKADRIFRIAKHLPAGHTHGGKTAMVRTSPMLASAMQNEFPEVESAARFSHSRNVLLSYGKKDFLEEELFWADPEIF